MAVFGDTLRQARAYKGVTLKEAEQATRINRHHLSALEDENFGVLPPLIYQRGIVRNYATYLDLDPGKLLGMFEEARGGGASTDLVAAVKPLDMPNHWAPNFAIIAFMVVMSAIVFAWVYSAIGGEEGAASTEPAVFPTVTPLAPDEQMTGLLTSPTPEPARGGAAVTPSPTVRVISAQIAAATVAETPTPRAVRTETPRPTPTPESPAPTLAPPIAAVEPSVAQVPAEAPVVEPAVEPEPPAPQSSGSLTIAINPTGGVYLTVRSANGDTLFDGWLEAGQSTGPMSADQFIVQTTDSALTEITNFNTNQTFNMGAGINEFTLP